ncbi:FtsX-like permease family protein [Pseudoalteromonas rubra]|uniref:FtsX-like permease family protein n=1 Tax=Pseudoalteromonas rubra TaxID=43658 RepID=A0A5S3UST9_9GAMM|nr:ABC transporter permease [Pseudoalteromonas rubra]QPB83390.1 FtsX-like permease family protein [Pseudoalteromonas rubra]
MISLLFTMTWRNMLRSKRTTVIQLLSLIIGLTCFMLIQLYVAHQHSFNSHFKDADNIYRINLLRDDNRPQTLTPLRLAEELTSNFPEITDTTRISVSTISVRNSSGVFAERALFVDENFFSFFDYSLIEGDVHTALQAPDKVVLHEAQARKYFSRSTQFIGEQLDINGKSYQVAAIIKYSAAPSTIPREIILPIQNYFQQLPNERWRTLWNFNATITFAKVTQATAIKSLTASISDYYQQRVEGLSSYKRYRVMLEPLLDVYLNATATRSLIPPGSREMVDTFVLISFMLLVLACINFTNLATATSLRRAREVGIKKALGASPNQLALHYLIESLFITLFALGAALALTAMLLGAFNQLMGSQIALTLSFKHILTLILTLLCVTLLAGGYPALFLSRMNAALVLKGVIDAGKGGVLFRRILMVIQFIIAMLLLIASTVVSHQMHYLSTMAQGYDRENVLIINPGAAVYQDFKRQVSRFADVASLSMSHTIPTKATRTSAIVRTQETPGNEIWVGNNPVSYDYFRTMGITLLSGRVFQRQFPGDPYFEDNQNTGNTRGNLIINATLAAKLDADPNEIIGRFLTLGSASEGLHRHQVIGVVEDTHHVDASQRVPPMIYVLSESPEDMALRWIAIRLKSGFNQDVLQQLEQTWLALDSNRAFKYEWLSGLFDAQYHNQTQHLQLLELFTLIALVMSVAGLYAVAAFTLSQSLKEIAIRQIMGAKNWQIYALFQLRFGILVLFATLVALPIAFILLGDWLNQYIYRIELPTSAFVMSSLACLAMAGVTVQVVALKAVRSRPVDTLKRE